MPSFRLIVMMMHVAGMMLENLLTQSRHVDMGVDNRCGYALMTEHSLNGTQVGTTLKQRSGKGVAEGVRRDGLCYARILGILLHHD